MIQRHSIGDITWIDIYKPTIDDIAGIREEFHLHHILCEDLLTPSLRQRVELYGEMVYLVLHFPVLTNDREKALAEVDFVLLRNILITVRYDEHDPQNHFVQSFRLDSILESKPELNHAGYFLYFLLRKLYDATLISLSHIGERLGKAEDGIFHGKEQYMVEELSKIHRDVLLYNRALRHHKTILRTLEEHASVLFNGDFHHWASKLMSEYLKVDEKLDDRKEMVNALRSTNDSLLAAKTNTAMRALTVASVPIFLSTLLATLLLVDAGGSPVHNMKYGFWFIASVTLATLILTYMILSHKHQGKK
jgi:magnesium transporter